GSTSPHSARSPRAGVGRYFQPARVYLRSHSDRRHPFGNRAWFRGCNRVRVFAYGSGQKNEGCSQAWEWPGRGRKSWLQPCRFFPFIIIGRGGEEGPEFFLVEAFIVGLFWRNPFHAQVLHDRIIERLIAELLADLDHARNLVRFPFAHEVGNGRGEDE